nr:hypothetical protein [Tanacetum cinerariifolium]GFC72371.1 hypothetical protein [Tanacetum cinerariifolium]
PWSLFVAGEGGRVFVGGSGSGGVGWKRGGSGVKGMAGKPGIGATVLAILKRER